MSNKITDDIEDDVTDEGTDEAAVSSAGELAGGLSPVVLAFMGDAVYETLVRRHLIASRVPASKLHRACVGFVKASAQANAVRRIMPVLTSEERTILRRGRNANTTHVPKNAVPSDYRYATGLEALFGYLYICNKKQRIGEIFEVIAAAEEDGTGAGSEPACKML